MKISQLRRSRAFTLVELIVVMVLLGIIGALAAGPTLNYVRTIRTRGAAGRIAADLRYAQRWAMSTRNQTWVAFNVAGNAYQLYVENPANPGRLGRIALAGPLDNATGSIAIGDPPFSGVALSTVGVNATSEVQFDSLGMPHDANGVALPTDGAIGLNDGVTVYVRRVSGLAEVSE